MSKRDGDHGFAHSMTDLMAGVAVTFLLLAAIFMIQAARANAAARIQAEQAKRLVEQTKKEDDSAIRKLRDLGAEIGEMASVDARDPFLLLVVFQSKDWFPRSQCIPTPTVQAQIIDSVVPVFRKVCSAAYRDSLNSIVLEGHTDPLAFTEGSARCGASESCPGGNPFACKDVGFRNNVRLSAARAQEIFFEARNAFQAAHETELIDECLDHFFVVSGRGPVETLSGSTWRDFPGHPSPSAEVLARDRRVVLKVRFRSHAPLVSDADAGAAVDGGSTTP